jgi:hypothetical protein
MLQPSTTDNGKIVVGRVTGPARQILAGER